MRSVFVFNPSDLFASPRGGVQRCSQEFLDLVQGISSNVSLVPIAIDRRWRTRASRWLGVWPYSLYFPDDYMSSLCEESSKGMDVIFLNKAELLRFVPAIRARKIEVPIILLSHGNESGDALHDLFIHHKTNFIHHKTNSWSSRLRKELYFGKLISFEATIRASHEFKVCTLSAEEEVIERWLGARDTFFLPRRIDCDFIKWTPQRGRLGYIGTLNHTPNIVALRAVLDELMSQAVAAVVDIIGGPDEIGRELVADYPNIVQYRGPLSDEQARVIMGHWSLALNPIFWLSRGASMKLAHLLGWGVPTLTTSSGKRGYDIPNGIILESEDNPATFVKNIARTLDNPEESARVRTSLHAWSALANSKSPHKEFRDWVTQRSSH